CFGYGQMQTYLKTISSLVGQYYKAEYPKLPAPRNIVFIANQRTVHDACEGRSDSMTYAYCGADQTIYIGQNLLWSFYSRNGDAAPIVGLAHEWGHHIQVMMGLPSPRGPAESVKFENQADCLAGSFIKYADEKKWLEANDLGDIQS